MNNRFLRKSVFGFSFFLQLLAVGSYISCGLESNEQNNSPNSTSDTQVADGLGNTASVTWACDGSKFFQNGPLVAQDEYCEWNRSSTTFGKPLQCRFSSNFYSDLGVALTANRAQLTQTQFNSWTCLTGQRDGNGNEVGCPKGSGIVPECISGLPCEQGTCVPTRASDPAICKALNRLNSAGFGVALPQWRSHPLTLKPSKNLEKNCTSNSIGTLVECRFQASPYNTCDQVAKEISVTVRLSLTHK